MEEEIEENLYDQTSKQGSEAALESHDINVEKSYMTTHKQLIAKDFELVKPPS